MTSGIPLISEPQFGPGQAVLVLPFGDRIKLVLTQWRLGTSTFYGQGTVGGGDKINVLMSQKELT